MSSFKVKSFRQNYEVVFDERALEHLSQIKNAFYIIDKKVASLYSRELKKVVPDALIIEAREESKSLAQFTKYTRALLSQKVKRDHHLIAIGGGIIQDITAFLSAIYMRGVPWSFIPTTLLSQADSCIGSKSSINVDDTKNVIGTFSPPTKVFISSRFLKTLSSIDLKSGIGEIFKIHLLHSENLFLKAATDLNRTQRRNLTSYIERSLWLKKKYIEIDEFDTGFRQLLNYGHTFGHAIESATEYAIPHGIAVSMGMDLANFMAYRMKRIEKSQYQRIHQALKMNFNDFEDTVIPEGPFFEALKKDKKNLSASLVCVLPNKNFRFSKCGYTLSSALKRDFINYFSEERSA